jgi:cytochrome c oxidase subunit 4
MANANHDDAEHGGHDDGAVHVHIHSIKFYAAILGTLIFLTVLTVATSLVDIDGFVQPGTPQGAGGFNLALAMIIATIKAGFVVTFFMHLRDDSRFNALVFVGSVLFAGIFLAYTMNDTANRGHGDPFYGVHVLPTTGERAPGGVQCRFEGEETEPGVVGADIPICGYDSLANHMAPCHFVGEDGALPASGDVCIWEHETIIAVSQTLYNGGRHGDPPPAHEGGGAEHSAGHGEHAEGAEHGEGGEHHE